jgi:hypothetical protein
VGDIFVRDRQTAQTVRISLANNGAQANGSSFGCAFSADGRFLAFASHAANLVPGDTNAVDDVFVRDLFGADTERVSLNSAGVQGNGNVANAPPAISANGRFVVFAAYASNLVAGDTNSTQDVFVRDRQTGQTERVSVNSSGVQMPAGSYALGAAVSADGRFVAFHATAPNLPGGNATGAGIFVRDRLNSTTTRVSVNSNGAPENGNSVWPSMSADGRYVAFESGASDQVEGDAMTRAGSLVMLFFQLSPAVAPLAGQGLLRLLPWQGIFVLLATVAALLAVWTTRVDETLTPERQLPLSLARSRPMSIRIWRPPV